MIKIKKIRSSTSKAPAVILYQHVIPPYRYELFSYFEPEITIASSEIKDGKHIGYLLTLKIVKTHLQVTISKELILAKAVIIPNNPYDIGLWLIAIVRRFNGNTTFYRGHAGSLKKYDLAQYILRKIIDSLQIFLSAGILGYVKVSSNNLQSANYVKWKSKFYGSNNIHLMWRGLAKPSKNSMKTAFFIGTNKKKQKTSQLLEFVRKTNRIETIHLIGDFEDLKLHFTDSKFVFHGPIYNEQEKDEIIMQCGYGLSLGSLGLFVIDCLSRNRPILGLTNHADPIGHAPEADFVKYFPGSVLCIDESELEVQLRKLVHVEIDYQKIYEANFSYSSIKKTYIDAINERKSIKYETES
ncbi:hypothetical protein N9C82_01475 [bacterium]|nr:hypothetical protein [bacterium]